MSNSTPIQNLLVIDNQINNWQALASSITQDTALLIIDSSTDGLTQLSDYLNQLQASMGIETFTPLQSIQIISHGTTGSLLLGNSIFNTNNLKQYTAQLTSIGNALSATGDILLYGCNIGSDLVGLDFINQLAGLTNADVAASNDITGSVAVGGNWILEANSGTINTQLAINNSLIQTYNSTLGLIVTSTPNTFAEDATSSFDIVLSVAPAFDVQVIITLATGLSWSDGTTLARSFTFTPTNWFNYQTISFKAFDDLLIEGDLIYPVSLNLQSADPTFNSLSETLQVSIIDNDFVRSLEPTKLPSAGNNAIKYDLTGDANAITSRGTYDLGAGNDLLEVTAAVQASAAGTVFLGNTGDDRMTGVAQAQGGDGNDTLEAAGSVGGTSVSRTYFDYAYRNLGEVYWSRLAGGAGNDVLVSSPTVAADLVGGSGNDSLTGGAGADYLNGDGWENFTNIGSVGDVGNVPDAAGARATGSTMAWGTVATVGGNDTLHAGAGNDTLYGGVGADQLYGEGDNDALYGEDGTDTLDGGDGNDTLSGGNHADSLIGGAGNDTLDGGADNDTLLGGAGADSLSGGDGNDSLNGGTEDDYLDGGAGNDTLIAGEGADTLTGGLGDV